VLELHDERFIRKAAGPAGLLPIDVSRCPYASEDTSVSAVATIQNRAGLPHAPVFCPDLSARMFTEKLLAPRTPQAIVNWHVNADISEIPTLDMLLRMQRLPAQISFILLSGACENWR
jgi:hypothetical protein